MKKKGRGRPPLYTNPAQMQERIDAYFESCRGHYRRDDSGAYVLDRHGRPIVDGEQPVTMSGLQLALGFRSRQSLSDYRSRGEYRYVIERARLRVECYAEQRLFDRDGYSGAAFVLKTAFDWGHEDSQGDRQSVPTVSIIPAPSMGANARKGAQEPF